MLMHPFAILRHAHHSKRQVCKLPSANLSYLYKGGKAHVTAADKAYATSMYLVDKDISFVNVGAKLQLEVIEVVPVALL